MVPSIADVISTHKHLIVGLSMFSLLNLLYTLINKIADAFDNKTVQLMPIFEAIKTNTTLEKIFLGCVIPSSNFLIQHFNVILLIFF